ncbi:hypothetical protein CRUP_000672 [Coryphaenoides rupestris]|nr:hypothetical protein CRUP_000672 [Coryphaenoides rupestris]
MQIFLSFGVFYDDGPAPSQPGGGAGHKGEELRRELNTTLAAIEETSHRVEKHVFQMFRFYNFGRMRKSGDYFLLLSNGRYVTRWSAAQSVAIMAAGYLQLLFLKQLFISNTDAKLDKPRC